VSWLLDTNTCSYVLKRQFGVAERLQTLSPADLHVCAITLGEAYAGARKSPTGARLVTAWEFFLHPFADRILPFDKEAAIAYGDIRGQLERRGNMLGDRDCMIAAIARCRGLGVVTANLNEFRRVSGLAVEDWRQL
jgi:tRNA(fMet)-specific endonuclease VapC